MVGFKAWSHVVFVLDEHGRLWNIFYSIELYKTDVDTLLYDSHWAQMHENKSRERAKKNNNQRMHACWGRIEAKEIQDKKSGQDHWLQINFEIEIISCTLPTQPFIWLCCCYFFRHFRSSPTLNLTSTVSHSERRWARWTTYAHTAWQCLKSFVRISTKTKRYNKDKN